MWQDIRLALRGFRKTPVFAVALVTSWACLLNGYRQGTEHIPALIGIIE